MAEAAREFDVVVVGGGPGGEVLAGRCADGGLSVALVESERVGGECSFWACIPSKALLRPGEVLAAARRVPGAREDIGATALPDARAALARRDALVNGWDDSGQLPWLAEHKVTLVRGAARIEGPRKVAVRPAGGGGQPSAAPELLVARRAVVLATGTVASVPPIPGLRDAHPWTSREATAAKAIPRRLLVLGGGAVGVEMAQAYRRLGASEVTVVEAMERLLAREEPVAGERLAEAFRAEGIAVHTGRRAVSVRRAGPPTGAVVEVRLDDGRTLSADEILVAVGRRPNTAELGLDRVGLEPNHSVPVDDQLRAQGVDGGWLYAIGDVNGRSLFTHMAKYQARIAADHILGRTVGGKPAAARADAAALPRVIFTDPQVAAVGPTSEQVRERGLEAATVDVPLASVAAVAVRGEDGAGPLARWIVDPRRRVVLGATLVGPEVGELLHAATVAIAGEVPLERLAHAVPAFPTVSEIWLELLEATPD